MPKTKLVFYQDENGYTPVIEWLRELKFESKKAFSKCMVRLNRLAEAGHELRRPECDFLRDDILELRSRVGRVNYRVLYAFNGQGIVIIAHGCTKEGEVPNVDINLAIKRQKAFKLNPAKHTYTEDFYEKNKNI
jgi:phage-related protein